ncbi:cytochrome P450 6B1-like [Arctopsyche grandis]|uniref:cytochrome P450 6B1-like n=1 Tax=Arctopsyche grandis TaxID=121162 RepID=UPI00406D90B6
MYVVERFDKMFNIEFSYFNSVILASLVLVLFFRYITKNYNYWKDRNVAYIKPLPFVGNYLDAILMKKTVGQINQHLYDAFPNEKYVGAFRMRSINLLIKDPELIKEVMIKSFNNFHNRFSGNNENVDPLLSNLFSTSDDNWRNARQKLTPIFTTAKLKNMLYLILEKGKEFEKLLDVVIEDGKDFEVKELMARFTTDVIGTCGFGVSMNSMLDTEAPFRKMGRDFFKRSIFTIVKGLLKTFSPGLFYFLGFKLFPKRIETFFMTTVKEMTQERETTKTKRNDFIDLLLELKHQNDKIDFEIDDKFMAAQVFVFFIAGFETSSTLMSFALYELARHKDIQSKLIMEIDTILDKSGGKMTYENIMEMDYLEMVVNETMRKYPALGMIPRICTNAYKIPQSDIIIEKGVSVIIPVLGLHYDPKYYPEPEKFIPERFTKDAIKDRHPMVFLPFGEGPRNCIGLRFGKIQSKIGLITLLRRYSVEPSPKTQNIRFDPAVFIMSPKNGIWLNFKKRNVSM